MIRRPFTLAIAICAYGKPLLLSEILVKAEASNIIDAIYVLDGPYDFNKDMYAHSGFYSSPSDSEIKFVCESHDMVNYQFGIFKDEAEKRVQLYDMARESIVCLLDLDEIPTSLDYDLFLSFHQSDCAVGGIEMVNIMNQHTKLGDNPIKTAVFKRDLVSSRDHLNFTWLVGISQEIIDPSLIFSKPLTRVLHFYALRDRDSLLQKFVFYTTLWHYRHNGKIFLDIPEYIRSFGFTYDNALERDLMLESALATDRNYLGMMASHELIRLSADECKNVEDIMNLSHLSIYEQDRILVRNNNQPVYLLVDSAKSLKSDNRFELELLIANLPASVNIPQVFMFTLIFEHIINGRVKEEACDALRVSIKEDSKYQILVGLSGRLAHDEGRIGRILIEVRYNAVNTSQSTISVYRPYEVSDL